MTDAISKPKIPPHIAALLHDEKWALTSAKLTNYAHKRMGRRSIERAEEIAQEAITRLYDGEYAAWDPAIEPSLYLYLTSIVNGLAYGDRIKGSTNKEKRVTTAKMERQIAGMPSFAATPEEEMIARDLEAKTWAKIRTQAAGDNLVTKLTEMVENRIDEPAEQATALNEPIADVRNARRRLFALAETVARSFTEESP